MFMTKNRFIVDLLTYTLLGASKGKAVARQSYSGDLQKLIIVSAQVWGVAMTR